MHPTPVEEHSKVVRARNALLALQARAAAAAAAGGGVPVGVIDDHRERIANTVDPQSRMRGDDNVR
jgi:hypothetical protein